MITHILIFLSLVFGRFNCWATDPGLTLPFVSDEHFVLRKPAANFWVPLRRIQQQQQQEQQQQLVKGRLYWKSRYVMMTNFDSSSTLYLYLVPLNLAKIQVDIFPNIPTDPDWILLYDKGIMIVSFIWSVKPNVLTKPLGWLRIHFLRSQIVIYFDFFVPSFHFIWKAVMLHLLEGPD